jgi:dynein heavy chain
MKKYKDTNINILTGSSIEEIQTLLDDHSLKILTIKGSVYAKTFQN